MNGTGKHTDLAKRYNRAFYKPKLVQRSARDKGLTWANNREIGHLGNYKALHITALGGSKVKNKQFYSGERTKGTRLAYNFGLKKSQKSQNKL